MVELRVVVPEPLDTPIRLLPFSPAELQQWLEWAGSKLLAMNIRSPFPKEPGTAWPSYAQEAIVAYGYTNERLRPAAPTKFQITIMDEILLLPSLVSNIQARRIINARALVTPVSNRYLYSWSKIAEINHTSKFRVQSMHRRGLDEITKSLAPEKRDALRHSLLLHGT